ncbi:MAG: nitroreductase family protein [Candidatus Heimdallarchaeota archaeon]
MKYKASLDELVNSRVSRRNYINMEIEPKILKELMRSIKKPLIGPFGHSSRFLISDTGISEPDKKVKIGTYGMISGARYYLIGFTKNTPYNIVDFGFSMEKIILKTTDLELGSCWLGAKYASKSLEKQFKLEDEEFIPAITPIGYTKDKKSTKESVISWAIRARKRKPLNKLFFSGNHTQPLNKIEAGKFAIPLEWVRLAPSGRNTQQWRIVKEKDQEVFHFFIAKLGILTDERLSKLNLLDAGIALCHFELGVRQQKLPGKFYQEKPSGMNIKMNHQYIASWASK